MNILRACSLFAVIPVLAAATAPTKMPALSTYLMSRDAEMSLARSAAPTAISRDATILVLGSHGYVVAAKGDNGFTCLVERAWVQPFDSEPFWDPRMRAPTCYNPEASRTVLRDTFMRTALAFAGASRTQMLARIKALAASGALPTPQPGAMAYMMSKNQYLNARDKAWYPHLMFYEPQADGAKYGADWGADRLRSPVLFDSGHHLVPEPWSVFFIPVGHWSDGSKAASYTGT